MNLVKQLDIWESALKLRTTPRVFFHSLIGALLIRGWHLGLADIGLLANIFLIYGALMYPGIYGLNNYLDKDIDSQNVYKKVRSVASGRINATLVLCFSIFLIVGSLVLGFLLLKSTFYLQLYIIAVNLFYSLLIKRKNILVGSFIVASTDPAKLLIGVTAFGGDIGDFIPTVMLMWFLLFLLATYKHELSLVIFKSEALDIVRIITILFVSALVFVHIKLLLFLPLIYIPFYLAPITLSQISTGFRGNWVRELNR